MSILFLSDFYNTYWIVENYLAVKNRVKYDIIKNMKQVSNDLALIGMIGQLDEPDETQLVIRLAKDF